MSLNRKMKRAAKRLRGWRAKKPFACVEDWNGGRSKIFGIMDHRPSDSALVHEGARYWIRLGAGSYRVGDYVSTAYAQANRLAK